MQKMNDEKQSKVKKVAVPNVRGQNKGYSRNPPLSPAIRCQRRQDILSSNALLPHLPSPTLPKHHPALSNPYTLHPPTFHPKQPTHTPTMTTQPPTTSSSSEIDETPLSPLNSQHSLEKHLQMRPEAQDLKNRNILHDTNAAPYVP